MVRGNRAQGSCSLYSKTLCRKHCFPNCGTILCFTWVNLDLKKVYSWRRSVLNNALIEDVDPKPSYWINYKKGYSWRRYVLNDALIEDVDPTHESIRSHSVGHSAPKKTEKKIKIKLPLSHLTWAHNFLPSFARGLSQLKWLVTWSHALQNKCCFVSRCGASLSPFFSSFGTDQSPGVPEVSRSEECPAIRWSTKRFGSMQPPRAC